MTAKAARPEAAAAREWAPVPDAAALAEVPGEGGRHEPPGPGLRRPRHRSETRSREERGCQCRERRHSVVNRGTYGITCSMSCKGNCWGNAVVESFFSSVKLELVYTRSFQDVRRGEARAVRVH